MNKNILILNSVSPDHQNNNTEETIYGNVTPNISREVKVSIGDNGSQIKLNKGQILVISLEGNPTTGYTWEVSGLDTNIMRQVGEIEFQPESDKIGSGGMQILRLEAVNKSQLSLKLVYHRPWEKDVEPLKTLYLQVIVS